MRVKSHHVATARLFSAPPGGPAATVSKLLGFASQFHFPPSAIYVYCSYLLFLQFIVSASLHFLQFLFSHITVFTFPVIYTSVIINFSLHLLFCNLLSAISVSCSPLLLSFQYLFFNFQLYL